MENGNNVSRPGQAATLERTKAKAKHLKHGRFAGSVFKSHPVGYESKQYSSELAVFTEFKRNTRLPPALQEDDLESSSSSLLDLLRSAFIPKEHRASLFCTVEEVKFWREGVWVCRVYHYIEERVLNSRDESAF